MNWTVWFGAFTSLIDTTTTQSATTGPECQPQKPSGIMDTHNLTNHILLLISLHHQRTSRWSTAAIQWMAYLMPVKQGAALTHLINLHRMELAPVGTVDITAIVLIATGWKSLLISATHTHTWWLMWDPGSAFWQCTPPLSTSVSAAQGMHSCLAQLFLLWILGQFKSYFNCHCPLPCPCSHLLACVCTYAFAE